MARGQRQQVFGTGEPLVYRELAGRGHGGIEHRAGAENRLGDEAGGGGGVEIREGIGQDFRVLPRVDLHAGGAAHGGQAEA